MHCDQLAPAGGKTLHSDTFLSDDGLPLCNFLKRANELHVDFWNGKKMRLFTKQLISAVAGIQIVINYFAAFSAARISICQLITY